MLVGTTVVVIVTVPTEPTPAGVDACSSAVPICPVPELPVTDTGVNVVFDTGVTVSLPSAVVPLTPVTAKATICPFKSNTTSPLTIFLLIGVMRLYLI